MATLFSGKMLNVTVKTLNAEDHSFQIPPETSVRQLKEAISDKLGIPADRQRLIFQGRVLHDDGKLGECGVDNKVIHLVESLLPARRSAQSESGAQRSSTPQGPTGPGQQGGPNPQAGRNVMIGAFAVPVTNLNPDQIMSMIRNVMNSMGEIGRSAQIQQQAMPDGSLEYRIQMQNDHNSEMNGPALARIHHIQHLLADIDHMLFHLDQDESSEAVSTPMEATTEGSTAAATGRDNIDSPPLLDSANEPCQGHAASSESTETPPADLMRISTLADLMGEALRIQDRLRPHLERYRRYLSDDEDFRQTGAAQRAQGVSRLFGRIQNVLHNLSHLYHAMSDLSVHFCEPPPRNLYPRLELSQQQRQPSEIEVTLTVQTAAVPVQVNINPPVADAGAARPSQPVGANIRPPNVNPFEGIQFGMPPGMQQLRMPMMPPFMTGPMAPGAMPMGMRLPPGAHFAWRQMDPNSFSVTSVSISDETPMQPGGGVPGAPVNNDQFNAMAHGAAANVFQQLINGIAAATGNMVNGGNLGRSVPNLATGANGTTSPQPPPANLSSSSSASNLLSADSNAGGHHHHSHPPHSIPTGPRSRSSDSRVPRARRSGASPSPGRPALFGPQHGHLGRIQFAAQPIRPGAGHPPGPPPLFVGPHPPAEIPLYTLDPFLPCSSRFFATQVESLTHRRPSEAQRQQQQPTPNAVAAETAAHPSDADVTNARFAQQFESIMRSVMHDMISLPTPGSVDMNGPHPSMFQFNLVNTMAPQRISVEMPIQMEIRTPAAPPPTRATPTQQPTSPSNGQSAPQRNPQVDTANLIAGVVSSMAQGSDQSLAQFLQGMGENVEVENEGLMGEIFHLVSTQLSFRDITSIFAGNYGSLNQLRPHLMRFLAERFYDGNRHPSRDDITRSARQIVADNETFTREYVVGVNAVDGVDLVRTILSSERRFLEDLITLIFSEPEESDSFGRIFYERLLHGVEKNVAVVIHSNADGRAGAQRVVQNILRRQMDGIPPEFQGMLTQAGLGHFQRLIDRAAISSEELAQLTVRVDDPVEETPPVEQPSTAASAAVESNDATLEIPKVEEVNQSVSSDSGDEFMDVSETPHTEPVDPAVENAWRQNVPPEWVEVIEADIVLQRNMPPQSPFSDAYMFGMPSKRRKVLNDRKPKIRRSPTEMFRETLRDAVNESGVQPITGEAAADVVSTGQLDPVLLQSYEAEMKAKVAKRIRSDPDFNPEQFPNAAAYFK